MNLTVLFSLCLAVFCAVIAPFPVFAKGCLNGSCHQDLTTVRYMHGPVAAEMAGVDACTMCHVPAGPKCSAKKGGKFRLKDRKLCTTCHEKGTGTQHSAKEIESKCLNCHDPHGSETSRQMLRAGKK